MNKPTVLDRVSTISQFIIGFILGVTLITTITAGLGYLYFRQMSVLPKKPEFPEVKKTEVVTKKSTTNSETTEITSEAATTPAAEELPPNAYKAKVTWPQGLSLRDEPDSNAATIGGIAYDNEIVVLEETSDKKWQKVLIPWSEQEGWVRGGNTEKISN
jgi:hypothetical protein